MNGEHPGLAYARLYELIPLHMVGTRSASVLHSGSEQSSKEWPAVIMTLFDIDKGGTRKNVSKNNGNLTLSDLKHQSRQSVAAAVVS